MTDNRTMADMLRAPTEGCAEAIVVPPILAEQFKFKYSLINMMTSEQFFGLEKDNPHDHIRWFNKITSTIKYRDVSNSVIKLILFPFSLARTPRWWLEKEPSRSITTWDDLVSKFINEFFPPHEPRTSVMKSRIFSKKFDESFHEAWERYKYLLRACPHHGFTELHQLNTFYNALNPTDQDSLNAAAGGNLLETSPQDALTIIENKSKMNIDSTSGSGSLPGNTVANPKGEFKAITTHSGLVTDGPTVPTLPKSITPKVDERVEETYTDPDLAEYTIKVPPPLELANIPLNENCSAVILKKLLEKLRDPEKFLISCGFSELKCKALADLSASINLMPLSVWKKLGFPDLIPTRMTLKLTNRAICTPDGIARDVFVSVGKFTFPADFVVVDYESDPRVSLILGKPFLRTARALIDVHDEEMILHDDDERLTLNMKHDTTSYSNHPHRESVNLLNIFNVSSEDCLKVSVSNQQSGNPTFSLHKEITSSKVTHEIHDSEGYNFLSEDLPDIDSFNDIHPYFNDNPLSGSTTYSSNSLLEEFTDELALITYPSDYDDNLQFDIESDLREIEFLLYQGKDSGLKDSIDQTDLANLNDYFVDPTPEIFTDEHALDYSFPPRFDVVDDLPSPDNEDKVFNPGILIQEKYVKIITRVAQEKKLAISYASLVFEDFDPPFYEPLVFKDVPNSMMLLPFSSENEEKVFKPGIYTSEKVKEKQENDKIRSKPDKNEK
nr:reverse transcriptase domain-containing protein [Tanacetum cinerariifolium]